MTTIIIIEAVIGIAGAVAFFVPWRYSVAGFFVFGIAMVAMGLTVIFGGDG